MGFRYRTTDAVEAQLNVVLNQLSQGYAPHEIERKHIEIKEEYGRRRPDGSITPGDSQNEQAAARLADQLSCMSNTPDAGALILGVADDGTRIGTHLDEDWLRHRIYELTDRKLTAEVRVGELDGIRLLILRVPEAVEPIRRRGRIFWRVADNCVEVDAATWHEGRLRRAGFDWSAQLSGFHLEDVDTLAVEVARSYVREGSLEHSPDLATAATPEFLRRLGAATSEGQLTNGGALLFVGSSESGLDYIRRDYPAGDSTERIRASGPLIIQIQRVENTARALNRLIHLPEGFVQRQIRALPPSAMREAIVNGVVHRDWHSVAPTVVEHTGDNLTVTSPGGFIGGVSPRNIISHPSTPRYRHLADMVSKLNLAEREGIGIDRMVASQLAAGRQPPHFSDIPGPFVRVVLLGGPPDTEWLEFQEALLPPQARNDVEVQLILHRLTEAGWVDATTAAPILQRSTVEAADSLERLARHATSGVSLVSEVAGSPSGSPPAWRLADVVHPYLSTRLRKFNDPSVRQNLFMGWALNRGRISSTEAADLTGLSTTRAGMLLRELQAEGRLKPGDQSKKTGRGYHYVPVNQE